MKRTLATKPGEASNHVELTQEEVDAINAEAAGKQKDFLYAHLEKYRFEVENGGIQVGDLNIPTRRGVRADLIGSKNLAVDDPDFVLEWKITRGQWMELNALEVIAAADAVGAFVAKVFRAERHCEPLIENGTLTTNEKVETEFNNYMQP